MNRPLATQQQTGGGSVTTISKMEYNEIGQSITKHLGSVAAGAIPASATFLQHINLRYNERGWLSTINDPTNLNDANYPGVFDVFAERLDYDKPVNYATIPLNYNGNITSMAWQTKTPGAITGFTQERKGYIFTYDAVNQMTASASQADISGPGLYNENITYDNLGNILSLTRQNGTSVLNNLTYSYMNGSVRSNRLMSVSDAGTDGQNSNYTYDANDSLLSDSKKLITTGTPIVYNELSLPSMVTFNTSPGKTLAYKYDAMGKKLERITTINSAVTESRVYDDGIEYTGAAGTTLEFVHTAEGRAVKNGSNYNYQYQVTDHLGNVRAMFADANNNSILTADEIIQFTDYYPFGREISYPSLSLTPANNYKYNGKEFQTDLSEYDYGARFYDAVIARWNVVDPMAEVNRRFSPYSYVKNSPVNRIDPDGMIDLDKILTTDRDIEEAYQRKKDERERKSNELTAGTVARLGLGWKGGGGTSGSSGCCIVAPWIIDALVNLSVKKAQWNDEKNIFFSAVHHSKPIKSATTGKDDAISLGYSAEQKSGRYKVAVDLKFGLNAKKGYGIGMNNKFETPIVSGENNNEVYYNQMTDRTTFDSETKYNYGIPYGIPNPNFDFWGTHRVSLDGAYVEVNTRESVGIYADAENSLSSIISAWFDKFMHPQKYIGE